VSSEAIAGPSPVGSQTILRFLPLALRVPERPLVAIAVGWLVAFPVSILFAWLASLAFPHAAQPELKGGPALVLFSVVVLSPVAETLVMGGVLLVLVRLLPESVAILLSAIGWGIVHSLATPTWGLAIWWPFLIFSTLFVTWRRRSLWLAFLLPMCTHALQNLLPALLIASGKGL
jgi:hypothetical protein